MVPAAWIVRLRDERCLWDDEGTPRRPEELFRRTSETEGLPGAEPFVARRLDGEKTPQIPDLLGVMAKPQDLSRILQRLPWTIQRRPEDLDSAGKLYRALEVAVAEAAGARIAEVREMFATMPLAVCADGNSRTIRGLFVAKPDGIPGVATIHPRFAHMRLWTVLDVPPRPTAEFVVDWLRTLEPGKRLARDDFVRVRAVLRNYPDEAWERVGCWLDVGGGWRCIEDFAYFVDRDDPYDPSRLFADVRQRIADLRGLPERFVADRVASRLPSLVDTFDLRPGPDLVRLRRQQPPGWLRVWARNVARIDFDEAEVADRARRLAAQLSAADWVFVRELRLVPQLDGRPVDEPVQCLGVAFRGEDILFEDAAEVRCVPLLAEEVQRRMCSADIGQYLVFYYQRPQDIIDLYFLKNFRICEEMEAEASGAGRGRPPTSKVATNGPAPTAVPASTREAGHSRAETGRPVVADTVPHGMQGEREQMERRERRSEGEQLIRELAERLELREDDETYVGSDGRVLRRSETSRGLWELRSPDGRLQAMYWVRVHCLDRQPLEVPAEIWERVRQAPQAMTFVLLGTAGRPRLLIGNQLLEAAESGRLELFPASYRLRQRR